MKSRAGFPARLYQIFEAKIEFFLNLLKKEHFSFLITTASMVDDINAKLVVSNDTIYTLLVEFNNSWRRNGLALLLVL